MSAVSQAPPPQLVAPTTKPVVSVARITAAWYVACESRELGRKPLARTILGVPLVLFRDGAGTASALLDRCPHRNVPLSLGKVVEGRLQCGYHGWEFDGGGVCQFVPGLTTEPEGKARRAAAYPTVEQDGYVWVWADAETPPVGQPYALPTASDGRYTTVRQRVTAPATVHATIENALDVPHTAFLHAGLFRGAGEPNDIEAVVRRGPDRVEAEYIGEPRPEGLVGRMLSPSGGVVTHFDRFILPSIAQVEYRIGEENHILVTSLCTPVSDFETALYAAVSFRLRIPSWLVRPVLQPVAMSIFKQDVKVLREQTAAIHRFGGEQYASTELDLIGGPMWRMLKAAERGDIPAVAQAGGTADEELRRVTMRV